MRWSQNTGWDLFYAMHADKSIELVTYYQRAALRAPLINGWYLGSKCQGWWRHLADILLIEPHTCISKLATWASNHAESDAEVIWALPPSGSLKMVRRNFYGMVKFSRHFVNLRDGAWFSDILQKIEYFTPRDGAGFSRHFAEIQIVKRPDARWSIGPLPSCLPN